MIGKNVLFSIKNKEGILLENLNGLIVDKIYKDNNTFYLIESEGNIYLVNFVNIKKILS